MQDKVLLDELPYCAVDEIGYRIRTGRGFGQVWRRGCEQSIHPLLPDAGKAIIGTDGITTVQVRLNDFTAVRYRCLKHPLRLHDWKKVQNSGEASFRLPTVLHILVL